MTLEELREQNLIILECISGSKAQGLDSPSSDTDIRGVFILPKKQYYGFHYIGQVNNESHDTVFYELGRFMELLAQNNPNIIELLFSPGEAVLYKHPFLDDIKPGDILSKLCKDTFGKFALSQIKKAKGLKKKIVNPVSQERKGVLSFCYVNYDHGAIPAQKFLELKNWNQKDCGLVKIPHMEDVYGLYHSDREIFNGIVRGEDSNEVALSSIPKGHPQETLLYFNRNGYSTYCKEYREYWEWVSKRNETRYENTKTHGKNYDAKNMLHVFRLLNMAIEIGRDGVVNVMRPDRDFLLDIKSGKYDYDELMIMAEEKQKEMENAFESSTLPDHPDFEAINLMTFKLREKFYNEDF